MSEQGESEVEHVSIMEYNENAAKQGREPGERVIIDDDSEGDDAE